MIAMAGICLVASLVAPPQDSVRSSNLPAAIVAKRSPRENAKGESSNFVRESDHTARKPKHPITTQPSESEIGHSSLGSIHAFPRLSGFAVPRR